MNQVKKIIAPETFCDSWHDYFQTSIKMSAERNEKPLKPRGKPCDDCAVLCGLYGEISDALKEESKSVQKFISDRWFCHDTTNRCCRGNVDNLKG